MSSINTVEKDFVATGLGSVLTIYEGDEYSWEVTGTYSASWVLQKSYTSGQTWVLVRGGTGPDSGTDIIDGTQEQIMLLRFVCPGYASGTMETTISSLSRRFLTNDEKVKVSNSDTTDGFLEDKLESGSGIVLTKTNTGNSEKYRITASITETDTLVKATGADTTAGTLNAKLTTTGVLSKSIINPGGNEEVQLSSSAEANTASNVGGERNVFKQKVGTDLQFRTLKEGANITITQNSDDLEIASTDTGVTDHGALTGLGDDDHTQYLTEARHDSLPQDNPHAVTKAQVGLGNADNTSDADKPVSTATQTALDLKYNASNPSGFETPAQLNSRDTANRDRANHTSTQLSSTISDFTEAAQDAVGSILTDTASVDFTYNDAGNLITADVLPAGVNHDALNNFVANKHLDHSTISISPGAGLSGGGTIAANRTLSVAINPLTGVTVASGDEVMIADISDSNNIRKVTAQSVADLRIFGSQFQFIRAAADSTTTSTTFVQAMRLTTTSLPAGNYMIEWSADLGNTNSDKEIAARIELNDTTLIARTGIRAKETNTTPMEYFLDFSGHTILVLFGVNTIDMDFAAGFNTAVLRNKTISLWRVS